jgi:hypothetical protein
VTLTELWQLAVGAVTGIGSIVLYLLILMIGFCLVLDRTKFRPTRRSKTIKSLDETVGPAIVYLPPDAPRGPSDQLARSITATS